MATQNSKPKASEVTWDEPKSSAAKAGAPVANDITWDDEAPAKDGEPTSDDDSHGWANYFAGLVKGAPKAAVDLATMLLPGWSAGQELRSLVQKKILEKDPEKYKQIEEAGGFDTAGDIIGKGTSKAVKAVTGFDAQKVKQKTIGDKFYYNLGTNSPFMVNPGGLVRGAITGVGATAGQTLGEEAGGVFGPLGALFGAYATHKVTGIPGAVKRAATPKTDEERGQSYVSSLAETSNRTPDQIEQFGTAPENQGKPFIGAEAIGTQGITATRALGLRQGTTGDILRPKLDERAELMGGRVKSDFEDATGVDPDAARGDIDKVVKTGRAKAKPLYTKAFTRTGTGGFEGAFGDSIKTQDTIITNANEYITDANERMAAAQKKLEEAKTDGARFAATDEKMEAQADLEEANGRLQQATDTKARLEKRMAKAKKDSAKGMMGGVWSDRIEEFLSDPIMKQGLARGLQTQRLEALAEGRKFDPRDFAITGVDAEGAPIIEGVPNMRLLDAGKRGLDEILTERAQNNKQAPGVLPKDENTTAILNVKNAYLKELDRLNTDYKTAREASSDYLSAQDSFQRAQKMFGNPNTTAKQFQDFLDGLGETDRAAAKGGVANFLFDQADKGLLASKKYSQPILAKKLKGIVNDPDRAATFLMRLSAERNMATAGQRMHPRMNSTTFESTEASSAMDKAELALQAAKAAKNAYSGNWLALAGDTISLGKRLTGQGAMSVGARNEAGRMLMLPPDQLAQELRKFNATKIGEELARARRRRVPLQSVLPSIGSAIGGNK
jgi:hypothetical protein